MESPRPSLRELLAEAGRRFFTIFAPFSDLQVVWAIRILTLSALVLFVACLAFLNFPAFAASLACAIWAYLFTREDVHRHPVEVGITEVRAEDDRMPEEVEEEAIYPVQAAGIPFSMEKRSRWARRKG